MAIQTYSNMANTFRNYNAKSWSQNVEVGSRVDFKTEFPQIETNQTSDKRTFGEFLSDSVAKVNDLQQKADTAVQKLASGESKNLHETLLAVETADIAFKQMNQVRMKVIDAYKEIMRMQV